MEETLEQYIERHSDTGLWGQHLKYLRESWRYDVANNDTLLGYWDWCRHQEEADINDEEE
jgi:hypothetical protein